MHSGHITYDKFLASVFNELGMVNLPLPVARPMFRRALRHYWCTSTTVVEMGVLGSFHAHFSALSVGGGTHSHVSGDVHPLPPPELCRLLPGAGGHCEILKQNVCLCCLSEGLRDISMCFLSV